MNIPEEMKKLPQWVCRKEKIPFNPVTGTPAKAGQPATWVSFEDVVNAFHGGSYDGIGFEFNNNGIVGIELYHVIADDGSLSAEAVEIVAMLDSYTEYSPSDKGLHIFVKADGDTKRDYQAIFYFLVIQMIQVSRNGTTRNAVFYEYYQKRLKDGKSKTQALICIARRLVNIVYGMLKNKTEYKMANDPKESKAS